MEEYRKTPLQDLLKLSIDDVVGMNDDLRVIGEELESAEGKLNLYIIRKGDYLRPKLGDNSSFNRLSYEDYLLKMQDILGRCLAIKAIPPAIAFLLGNMGSPYTRRIPGEYFMHQKEFRLGLLYEANRGKEIPDFLKKEKIERKRKKSLTPPVKHNRRKTDIKEKEGSKLFYFPGCNPSEN